MNRLQGRLQYLRRTAAFLKAHENYITIARLRFNQPLTASDLGELERMMVDAGVGTADDIARERPGAKGWACSSGR